MSVQKHLFNPISQFSPVIPTYDLQKCYDEEGNVIMTWEKTNGDSLIRANGSADLWSLDALMKAGINPESMHIHTGYSTRLDGINDLQSVAAEVEAAVNNNEKNSNK